ncbi:MAG: hypothetical protein ACYTFG_00115 [Planctomycetota bacterium]|jgi:hypothetical protein
MNADTNFSDFACKLANALTAPSRGARMFRIEEVDSEVGMGLLTSSGTPEQELWGLCSRLCSVSVRELRASKSYTKPVVETLSQLVCALPEELAATFDHAVNVLAEEAELFEQEQKAADEKRKAEFEAAMARKPVVRTATELARREVFADTSTAVLAKARGQVLVAVRTNSTGTLRFFAADVEAQTATKRGKNAYSTSWAGLVDAALDANLPKFWQEAVKARHSA